MATEKNLLPDPEVLFFQTSPYGNLDAIVQHNGETVYFYLNERPIENRPPKFGMRACWVRNLVEGKLVFNMTAIDQGDPPLFPRTHTLNREGQPIPPADSLSVAWFEEGNGAALVQTDSDSGESKTLTVIPPWSGDNGFMGYSLECAAESHFCSPLPKEGALHDRIEKAKEFWGSFGSDTPTPFAVQQPKQLAIYREYFGSNDQKQSDQQNEAYFNVNGDNFPPRGLVEFRRDGRLFLMTTGMSIVPQPNVELTSEFPSTLRRVELAFQADLNLLTDDAVNQARQNFSSLAALPWRQFNWLGAGHSCSFPDVIEGCDSAVLVNESARATLQSGELSSTIELGSFREDPVNLLWIVPVTNDQMKRLEEHESSVVELAKETWAD